MNKMNTIVVYHLDKDVFYTILEDSVYVKYNHRENFKIPFFKEKYNFNRINNIYLPKAINWKNYYRLSRDRYWINEEGIFLAA